MSFSFEGDDGRTKNLVVVETSAFEGETWNYQLTITDALSEGDEDGGKAMQVFWNGNPTKGIAIMKPYNMDRVNDADAGDAKYRIDYSEAGEHSYEASMIVSIAGLELPDPSVDQYAMNSLKMFVGKNGNQLDIYGKITFVQEVNRNETYASEAVSLLLQEKMIRMEPVDIAPDILIDSFAIGKKRGMPKVRPLLRWMAPAFAIVIAILWAVFPRTQTQMMPNRFVVYRPDVTQVDIVGTFTQWKPTAMQKIGSSGYWELKLDLPQGEHRFAYLLDGKHQWADPTVAAQEQDDFGGRNSIIHVGSKA